MITRINKDSLTEVYLHAMVRGESLKRDGDEQLVQVVQQQRAPLQLLRQLPRAADAADHHLRHAHLAQRAERRLWDRKTIDKCSRRQTKAMEYRIGNVMKRALQ